MAASRARRFTVVAQDPGVRRRGRIVTGAVSLPYEELDPGPVGHRVHVVDYDATQRVLLAPAEVADGDTAPTTQQILTDPGFHAQNVYAVVMTTLLRFESALGRRVSWGFPAHQLKVVPHAFEMANAFYSADDEALLFGWFRRAGKPVFTCLSHDIVVHETTHALVDGLRKGFMRPSSADQAAFHEGFADIVALLSVLAMDEITTTLVTVGATVKGGIVDRSAVTVEALRRGLLFGLAEQMDAGLSAARIEALRRSVELPPAPHILALAEFAEPHRRGEVLVAAVMNAFLDVWQRWLAPLGAADGSGGLDLRRVAEEGAVVAQQLLTAAIRGLDYTPPIHLTFGEFLSAVLTADTEVRADDTRYGLRAALVRWFAAYGIAPAGEGPDGLWPRSEIALVRDGIRFGSLRSDTTEMFRLLWSNREALGLQQPAYTRVTSVRPCLRVGPEDGLPVQETVAECLQYLDITAAELGRFGLVAPAGMRDDQRVVLQGGSTLVLDEYGTLKYQIRNTVPGDGDPASTAEAQERLQYLWDHGYMREGASFVNRLSDLHRLRALAGPVEPAQEW